MRQDVLRDEILVNGRIELFEKISSPGLEHPCRFADGAAPIGNMVKNAETENRVY